MKKILIIVIGIIGIFFAPTIAFAHNAIPGAGSFYSGVLHPATVPLHLLILIGLALWLGKEERLEKNFFIFSAVFFVSLIIAIWKASVIVSPIFLTIVAACIGTLVAADISMPRIVDIGLIIISMFLVGLDSGPGEIISQKVLLTALGTFIGIHLIVCDLAIYRTFLRQAWMQIGVRVIGSWIAASSIMVLALALRHT